MHPDGMMMKGRQAQAIALIGLLLSLAAGTSRAGEPLSGRKSILLQNSTVRLVMDLAGGSLGEFRFLDGELNPLHWATPRAGETNTQGFGHFLCLDRWGPPSAAEGAKGMPYHGEAAHVRWSVTRPTVEQNGFIEAEASARLPKAGLRIRRQLRLS